MNLVQTPINSCAARIGGWNLYREVETPTMTPPRSIGARNSLDEWVSGS
jgi:hypothetical protein